MVLDELHELIETLQTRIGVHASALQQNEALTRYALIDPMLRGLGWDTGDPGQVLVEFRSAAGQADYALLGGDGKPRVIVEAKKLGTHLGGAVQQVINYCIQDGFEHFVVTDGRHWEMYETHHKGPLAEKLLMRLDLKSSVAATCLQALALWRPSTVGGSLQAGATPVVGSPPEHQPVPAPPQEPGEHWHRLSAFTPNKGSKPMRIRFPTGDMSATPYWADLTAAVVEWLMVEGHLTPNDLPIRRANATRYIVSHSPTHPTGTSFKNSRRVQSVFIEMNYSAKDQVHNTRAIIERANLQTDDFAVRLQ